MSQTHPNPAIQSLEAIRSDDETRENVETLAERDDEYGALARVVLAIADEDEPSPADCKEAGVKSLTAFTQES